MVFLPLRIAHKVDGERLGSKQFLFKIQIYSLAASNNKEFAHICQWPPRRENAASNFLHFLVDKQHNATNISKRCDIEFCALLRETTIDPIARNWKSCSCLSRQGRLVIALACCCCQCLWSLAKQTTTRTGSPLRPDQRVQIPSPLSMDRLLGVEGLVILAISCPIPGSFSGPILASSLMPANLSAIAEANTSWSELGDFCLCLCPAFPFLSNHDGLLRAR